MNYALGPALCGHVEPGGRALAADFGRQREGAGPQRHHDAARGLPTRQLPDGPGAAEKGAAGGGLRLGGLDVGDSKWMLFTYLNISFIYLICLYTRYLVYIVFYIE